MSNTGIKGVTDSSFRDGKRRFQVNFKSGNFRINTTYVYDPNILGDRDKAFQQALSRRRDLEKQYESDSWTGQKVIDRLRSLPLDAEIVITMTSESGDISSYSLSHISDGWLPSGVISFEFLEKDCIMS